MTELVLKVFRANGRLLLAGDRLVRNLGLTSARWQVLGAVAAADPPRPVVRLAEDMGVSRQAVQRIANDLHREGVVAFKETPKHQRAQLVALTTHGRKLFEQTLDLQRPWAQGLAAGLTRDQIDAASQVLDALLLRLPLDAQ